MNEQYSKILAVFSPNDMKIIEGILDSGSGAELEEARETLQNVRKSNPNGGYIYPVTFTPENWFELLDNSFTGIDLLDSPEALSQKMCLLSNQRLTLVAQANSITEAIPDDDEIKAKKDAVDKAREELDTAENTLVAGYGEGAVNVLHAVLDIAGALGKGGVSTEILERLISENGFEQKDELVTTLTEQITSATKSQREYIEASQQLSDAQMSYIESKNMQSLQDMLAPIRMQIQQLDLEISNLSAKMKLSFALSGETVETGEKNNDDEPPKVEIKESIVPNNVYKSGFDNDRLQKMADCVFPCFPTAFVVARDVTVRLTTENAVSSETAMAMEQHASKGGEFLFFSASKYSPSSEQHHNPLHRPAGARLLH